MSRLSILALCRKLTNVRFVDELDAFINAPDFKHKDFWKGKAIVECSE